MKSLVTPPTFAALLEQGGVDSDSKAELRRQMRVVALPLALALALGAAWSAAAPLAGAIVARAQVKVELNRKTVQHQEGGIVREILVREGQHVRAGDLLVVVHDPRRDADLGLLQDQLRAALVRRARAEAEAALRPDFTASADPAAVEHLAREHGLFEARRRTLDEHIASLQDQVRDAQAQTAALETQIEATDTSSSLAAEELDTNEKLARQGFVHRTRILALQRNVADYRARGGEHRSEFASARQRIGELRTRIAQARNTYQSQAADELKEASAKVRELQERLRPSEDQVERQRVRSPVDGRVMAIRVSAVGEAIGPREPILDVVPTQEKLVVEARIRPEDIDYLRNDPPAEVRLTAFDARTTPLLPGKVVFVSPDRVTRPETGESWFVATVEVDAAALKDRPEIRLHAGMPAEVYVTTAERTLFEYLVKPLGIFASRAMREP
ncbi:MAG TPA: HlyD family type I secretion periplasmic adaptor subunit [Burkholderiaceae bacterium]|nr:HlyD family type I secretion periplasmic adaptor subunit [Burkholderiaceae bacterium]